MKNAVLLTSLIFALLPAGLYAQERQVTLTVRNPDHGRLTFDPALPADGRLDVGARIQVTATADNGYALDSLYHEVPGIFGTMYMESMTPTTTLTVDQDMTVSALFLPEQEFDGFTVRQDIVYARPGVKALDYDAWAPDEADKLPIILIIHGGGWRANTEDIMRGMARELVKTGRYVVISMDYRWIGTFDGDSEPNTMDDLVDDVFGAIAHVQEHAAEYGADPMRIAVTGDSAGGHLSAVAGTMPDMIGDGGFGVREGVFEFMPSYLPPGKSVSQVRRDIMTAVQATAPSYGVFSEDDYGKGVSLREEEGIDNPEFWAAVAPIHHIPEASERAVPHYLTRGTADPLINDVMVTEYVKALAKKNQRVRYDEVPNAGHAFFDWKPDPGTRAVFAKYGVPYTREMVRFFDLVFYPQ